MQSMTYLIGRNNYLGSGGNFLLGIGANSQYMHMGRDIITLVPGTRADVKVGMEKIPKYLTW